MKNRFTARVATIIASLGLLLAAMVAPAQSCTVAITSPANGASVSGSVSISGSDVSCPSDTFNRFYFNGQTYDKNANSSFSLDTTKLPDGAYSIDLIAWDRYGGTIYGQAPTVKFTIQNAQPTPCLLYTSPSPRDLSTSRMPSSA